MEHRKLDALMTPVERIARVAAAGVNLAKAPQTAPSGAISLDNADGTRTIIGEVVNGEANPSYTMATHVGDTTPPGIPTGITATSKSGVVVVEWDGTLSGGIPDDFFCVRVYLDNVELGALTEAGSVASAKLDGGTTVSITATSEDDCCLADGTPDHNVSQASQAISITVTSSAAEIIVDVEEEIEGVQREITDFKREVAADYYKSKYIDDNFSTVEEVGAVYRDSMARNLSPFYSHDFTDVSTTDSEAYWHTLTTDKTEQLSDGWAHVTLDNSAGTGGMYAYAAVRTPFLPIVAGTLMVEIRNVQVATAGRWGIGRTVQGLTFTALDVTEDGTYYRPCTVNDPAPANGVAMSLRFYAFAGVSVEFDARLSYYEGEYDGPFKAYVTTQDTLTREYATKTWTKQTAEDYSIGAAQKYTATIGNPNLAPYMEHPLSDVWNADTNPGGYWRKNDTSAQLTVEQLDDGWERVTCSGATATRYSYHRPMPQSWVKPGQTYTMLMEVRNASVTGAVKFTANRANYAAAKSQFTPLREQAIADGTYRFQLTALDDFSDCISFTDTFCVWPNGSQGSFEIRLSIYENAIGEDGNPITYEGPWKPYVTGQDALSKEYTTQSQLKVGIDGIRTEVSETYATKAIGAPNLNPFFAHDFLDIYNATTNPGGWWRGSVQRDFATQLKDGWARVVIDNTSGAALLARAFRFGATPNLKDGGKYTCLVEMRNILSKPTSATIYTQQGTDVQFWGDYRYDGWTVYWEQVEGDAHVEYKQMKRVEAVSRQTTGVVCFSMNVQVPAGQKADFEIRLSLFENETDSEGENIPYAGPYKPYVTDQQALGTTYTAKTTFEQTTQGFDSRITRNANNIAGEVLARETLIRQYANGVLVCKVGETVGALVNASGSFDVVAVTWSGNEPTVGTTMAQFTATDLLLGLQDENATISMLGGTGSITASSDWDWESGDDEYGMIVRGPSAVGMYTGNSRAVGIDMLKMWRRYITTEGPRVVDDSIMRIEAPHVIIGAGDYQPITFEQSDPDLSEGGTGEMTENTRSVEAYVPEGGVFNLDGLSLGHFPTTDPTTQKPMTKWGTAIKGLYFGSKVVNPAGAAYATLFTAAEAEAEFGIRPNAARDVVLAMNGDAGAYQGQLTAALTGGEVRVYANPTKNGNIRVNYIVILGA